MRVSRSEPGVVISSAAHAGLLVVALVLFSDARKFDDAEESIPVEVIAEEPLTRVSKGEKTAREAKPARRADKVARETEAKPHPPLAEAKKDVPIPPPPLKRLPDPGADDKPEPIPPKRVAALPPAPEPPTRPVEKKPEPPKPAEKPAEAKPAPAPPVKPKAAAPEKEQEEPKEAEAIRPKPPMRPKAEKEPQKEAKEAPKPEKRPEQKPEPEKAEAKTEPKPAPEKPRLKADDVAKLLEAKKAEEKPVKDKAAKTENSADGEAAAKSAKGSKPKSGDESAPKSKFDAASIANLLSKEAPQRRAATDREIKTASIGAPEASAPKLSGSMEARIASFIHDHYHPCWASALSLGGATFAPVVEFHLSREGALEGRPRLLNPSANPVEQARGEQALQAVRRCSPMRIPAEFMPYYEEALHEVTIRFQDAN
ncbi:cell envelope biogenesis protein TolA [Methylocystis sp. S23]